MVKIVGAVENDEEKQCMGWDGEGGNKTGFSCKERGEVPLPEPVFLKAPLLKATLHLWLTALKIPAQVAAFSSSDGGGGGHHQTAQHTAYSRICRPRIINKICNFN